MKFRPSGRATTRPCSPARVSVPDAVDVEVERSRAEIGALRASLAETRAHDAEATRARSRARRRVFSRRLRNLRAGVLVNIVAASFASGTDASLTFDVSRVSDATEDPRVEAKEWNVVLPDELEAGADGTRMSDETSEDATTERGRRDSRAEESSAGESSAEESSAGDAAPTARPDEDSGANVSNVSNVASDDEKESESGTFFDAQEDLPPAERGSQTFASGHETPSLVRRPGDGRGGGGGVAIRGEIGEIGARSPTPRRGETRGGARGGDREVKTLCVADGVVAPTVPTRSPRQPPRVVRRARTRRRTPRMKRRRARNARRRRRVSPGTVSSTRPSFPRASSLS